MRYNSNIYITVELKEVVKGMTGVFTDLVENAFNVTKDDLRALKARYAEDYNMDELGVILDMKGNILTVAAAGSGKTTALLLALLYDDYGGYNLGGHVLQRRPRVCVSTFLKAGAEDLKAKLSTLSVTYNITLTADITCCTLHSMYYRIVKQLHPDLQIITSKEQANFLHKAFDIPKDEDGREALTKIQGVITLINNMVDDVQRVQDGVLELGYTWSQFNAKLASYKTLKRKAKLFDFDDLQHIIYQNACVKKNESFVNFLQDQFDVFYCDEFQDISPIQYEILKVQSAKALKVFAIGDDDQNIYTWRGSDNNIILHKFLDDFKPSLAKLSVNYRCPANILAPARNVIEHNRQRHVKDIQAAKEGGKFEVKAFEDAEVLTKHLVKDIKEHIRARRQLTVLSRTNNSTYLTLLYLEADGTIDYGYFGAPINLVSATVAKYMYAPMLVDGLMDSPRSLSLILGAFDIKISWYHTKRIANYLKGSGYALKALPKESMQYLGIYHEELYQMLQACNEGRMTTIEFVLQVLYKYKDNQGYQLLAGMIDAFNITTVEHLNVVLRKLVHKFDYRYKATGVDLIITTIHSYKGLENDYILVAPVYDGVLPNRYDKEEGMQGDLTPEMAESLLEEERRLFYIACTRAKQYCGVYSVGLGNLFIEELGMPVEYIAEVPEEKTPAELDTRIVDLVFD